MYEKTCTHVKSQFGIILIVFSKLVVEFSEQYGRIFDELLSSLSIKTGNNYYAII